MTTEMTQHMADIIGAAQGDPGCRAMSRILEEDEPEVYVAEWRRAFDQGFITRREPAEGGTSVTPLGETARRTAITEGTVRA